MSNTEERDGIATAFASLERVLIDAVHRVRSEHGREAADEFAERLTEAVASVRIELSK